MPLEIRVQSQNFWKNKHPKSHQIHGQKKNVNKHKLSWGQTPFAGVEM